MPLVRRLSLMLAPLLIVLAIGGSQATGFWGQARSLACSGTDVVCAEAVPSAAPAVGAPERLRCLLDAGGGRDRRTAPSPSSGALAPSTLPAPSTAAATRMSAEGHRESVPLGSARGRAPPVSTS
jgi:hypothetical protein